MQVAEKFRPKKIQESEAKEILDASVGVCNKGKKLKTKSKKVKAKVSFQGDAVDSTYDDEALRKAEKKLRKKEKKRAKEAKAVAPESVDTIEALEPTVEKSHEGSSGDTLTEDESSSDEQHQHQQQQPESNRVQQ
jgi:hypothetical protein